MLHLIAQNPGGETTAYLAMGLGLVALGYLYLRGKARRRDPLDKPAERMSLAQQRSLERDMGNIVVELSEMARQITAQLDTRATKLEMLIKEADDKIARLEQMRGDAGGLPHAASSLPGDQALPEPPAPAEPAGERIDPRHSDVYALADQGHSAHAIAQQLNRPSGEVELILALRSTGRVL